MEKNPQSIVVKNKAWLFEIGQSLFPMFKEFSLKVKELDPRNLGVYHELILCMLREKDIG